jgi:hypothetical protein
MDWTHTSPDDYEFMNLVVVLASKKSQRRLSPLYWRNKSLCDKSIGMEKEKIYSTDTPYTL